MAIILDGTSGVTTPGVTNTGNETVAGNETITGTLTASSFNAASTFGFKNRIINGAMVIDQRNAGAAQTLPAGNTYSIDRWFVGAGTASVTGQRVAGSGGFQYAYRITGGASNTGVFLSQRIESYNAADLVNNTVTLQIKVSASAITSIGWDAYSANATDNFSALTSIAGGTISGITSTQQTFTVSFNAGANAANGIQLTFTLGAMTSGTFTITGVQLEKGSTATSFDYRPYGTELQLCQRYLPAVLGATNHFPAMAYSATGCLAMIPFPVTARTAPTGITVSSTSGFIAWKSNSANAGNPSSITFNAGGQYTSVLDVSGFAASSFTAGNMTTLQFNSSTGYVLFTGCEL